jgi:hypothetical protein
MGENVEESLLEEEDDEDEMNRSLNDSTNRRTLSHSATPKNVLNPKEDL